MRSLLVSILFAFSASAFADAHVFSAHDGTTMARLKRRCDAGVGKACYDYGHNLRIMYGKSRTTERMRYVHRACSLAYLKACKEVSPPRKMKSRQASRPKSNDSPGVAALSR